MSADSPKAPAINPCGSCPYRQDVPSGVWEEEEYDKLPQYDGETWEQPPAVFLCHQQNGRICAGWAGCHDMQENLGLRIAGAGMEPDDLAATLDYESPVPLWASGQEARDHGVAEVDSPGLQAGAVIDNLTKRRARKVRSTQEGSQ